MRHFVRYFLLLAAFAPHSVNAKRFIAPLPDGYRATGAKMLLGMYAEIDGLTSIGDDAQIEDLRVACRADGKTLKWQDREKETQGRVKIYRTATAVAVIRDSVRLTTDKATCIAGYVIDHDATVRTGPLDYKQSGYFQDPQFKCAKRGVAYRCKDDVIAGVRVTCLHRGDGLVGDVICVSRKNDLTRGLLVGQNSYVDDGSLPTGGWQLSLIVPKALIDPIVFRAAAN